MLGIASCSLTVTVSETKKRLTSGAEPSLILIFDLTVTSGMTKGDLSSRVTDGTSDGSFVRVLNRRSGLNVTSTAPYAMSEGPTSSPVKPHRGGTVRDAAVIRDAYPLIQFSSLLFHTIDCILFYSIVFLTLCTAYVLRYY
jgi:hypothetical protein